MRHFGVIICLVFVLCVAVSGQQPRRRAQPRGPGGPPPKPHSQPTARCTNTRPEKQSVKFYFYDKEHHKIPRIISVDKIKSGAFNNTNLNRHYKFLIHEYSSQGWLEWTWVMKEQYLKKGDYIVIVVDWSDYDCTNDEYPNLTIELDVKEVGESIYDFLLFLSKNRTVDCLYFHLIGHGVGAHVAGLAGNYTSMSSECCIRRITALDPAAKRRLHFQKLQFFNAFFVDVIYTDGELLGDPTPRGHINYYPNGGMRQPGCTTAECSHNRAVDYFIESINSREFVATRCDYEKIKAGKGDTCVPGNSTIMGDNFIDNYQGFVSYYIKTNNHTPFARGPPKA